MITTRYSNNGLILFGIFAALWIGSWVFDEIDFHRTYKELTSQNRIDSIALLGRSEPNPERQISIVKDSVLNQINATFQYFREFTPINPKMHSVFVEADIYKQRKCTLELLKTTNNGWLIRIGSRWYQDDSLLSVLARYSILDSLQ